VDILHPTDTNRKLEELERRITTLESHPQGYAQTGGQFVQDDNGRLKRIQVTDSSGYVRVIVGDLS